MKKDDFWSVERLLPKVTTNAFSRAIPSGQKIALSDLSDMESNTKFGPQILFGASRVIRSYRLSEETLPKDDALLLETASTDFSDLPFVPCSLFSPSFSALNKEQKKYFFYFCQTVKKEKKILLSFPYLQLYLCRLLRKINPLTSIPKEFFWVWKTYRNDFPLVDKLFCDFVADLSFYRKIPLPFSELTCLLTQRDFTIRPFLMDPFLFDYLFSEDHILTTHEMEMILRVLTHQSFRNSKAYRCHPNFAAVTDDAVFRALSAGLFNQKNLNDALFRIQIPSEVCTVRRLFQGLPSFEIPVVEIRLSYFPLLHDENIRSRCDEIIRYLENRIRAILKMKNSLSRIHIGKEHKEFLDAILLEYQHLSPAQDDATCSTPIVHENRPSPRKLEIDLEKASQIEKESWTLTQSLTACYGEEEGGSVILGEEADQEFDQRYEVEFKKLEKSTANIENEDFWELAGALTELEDSFLRCALHQGREEARRFALSHGEFFEAIISSCNNKATKTVSDSVFDSAGNLYDDYLEALRAVFPPLEGEE